MQKRQFLSRQRRRPAAWAHPGAEQRLIGINVSHSAEQLLIQQGAFDQRLAPAKQFCEIRGRYLKRLFSWRFKCLDYAKPAKAARINEAKFASRGETNDSVGMFLPIRIGRANLHAASHAEVHNPLSWFRAI